MRPDPATCRDPDILAAEVRRLQAVIDSGETTLTDAERQAVEAAVRIIIDYEDEMDGYPSGAAATLRGLLERTRATGSVKGLAAIRAAEQDAEITPEIAAALEGERNRATVKPKALPPRAS